jgi:hypothetical protein
VSKRFRTCDLDQVFLLPPSLQDWLPENHLARFIAEVTNELDLSKIVAVYGRRCSTTFSLCQRRSKIPQKRRLKIPQ